MVRVLPASFDGLRATAKAVADDVCARYRDEVDRLARWPRESLRALGEAGLLGLVVPVEQGGLGGGMRELAAVCEELGRVCPSSALAFGMHSVGTAVIASKATADQRERLLRPIARGEHVTTLALSEAGSGAHFYLPSTKLEEDGDFFVVDGRKHFVTSAGHADSYVISATAVAGDGPGLISCLVVEKGAAGATVGDPWSGFGMRGNDSRPLRLEGVRVPRQNLLGEVGDQVWYVFEVITPYFLVAMSATYLGLGRAILDETLRHLGSRRHEHAGASLAEVQVLQHRVGGLWASLEASRQLVHHAAARGDAGDAEALVPILASKAHVADTVVDLANEAMTLCGGIAYQENGLLSRFLRDARAAHVMAPTTDLLKTWAGRALLGQPLL